MNVPQLRFDGFEREWTSYKLGELTKLTDGTHYTPEYKEFGIPFWSVETITKGAKPKFISEEAHIENIKRCKPEYEDILVTRISSGIYSLGVPKLINWKEDFSIYVSVGLIKSNPKFSSEFLTHYIASPVYKTEFRSKSLLSATPKKINMVDFKNTKISLPEHLEQSKIASFFTLLEKRVERQQEKIEKLEQFKKGMMQKIFSQELRFKDDDGGEFGEWSSLQFGDVVEKLIGGGTPSRQVEEYYGGAIPWVTVKDLKTNKYVADAMEYITGAGLENSSSKIVEPGDLIIPTRMAVGRVLIATESVAINQDLKGCKLKSDYDTEFIYYLYFSKSSSIEKLGSGSTVTGININQLMKIKIDVPVFKEQKKIADYLGKMDKKTEKEKKKLMVLEEQKKGFMQGMFV